jgi:hypothetical protein
MNSMAGPGTNINAALVRTKVTQVSKLIGDFAYHAMVAEPGHAHQFT